MGYNGSIANTRLNSKATTVENNFPVEMARSICAVNGLLLIPEGKIFNDLLIEKLKNHNRTNPIGQSLMVYC